MQTENGHDTSPSFSRDRRDRLSVLVGRSRWCVGLHRDDDAFRNRASDHSSDCACAQHFGCLDRDVPILACWSFFLETILAICTAFDPGRICRRLSATICVGPKNFNWISAALLCGSIDVSAKRPSASVSSVAADGAQRRSWSRISCRTDRNRRRNISHATSIVLPVGTHSSGCRCLGAVHLGKLDRRTGWLLYENSFHPFARPGSRGGCDYRRHHRFAFGEQTFCCSRDITFSGDSTADCGNKTDFHKLETFLIAAGAASRCLLPLCGCCHAIQPCLTLCFSAALCLWWKRQLLNETDQRCNTSERSKMQY